MMILNGSISTLQTYIFLDVGVVDETVNILLISVNLRAHLIRKIEPKGNLGVKTKNTSHLNDLITLDIMLFNNFSFNPGTRRGS